MQTRVESTKRAILVTNGNYKYMLDLKTGSKIRVVPEPPALPPFPETVDLKVTNKCFGACPWCHENSTPHARETNWDKLRELLYTFPGGVEVAIGGGDPVEFPHLKAALQILLEAQNIPSLTVNTRTLLANADRLRPLMVENLFYGLGISVSSAKDIDEKLKDIFSYDKAVLHVIAGITSHVVLGQILEKYERLVGRPAKVLILGYKDFGRGKITNQAAEITIKNKIKGLQDWLKDYFSGKDVGAELISFDTRGVRQLEVEKLAGSGFSRNYMGDDGEFSMYINAHEEYASISSACEKLVPFREKATLQSLFEEIRQLQKT